MSRTCGTTGKSKHPFLFYQLYQRSLWRDFSISPSFFLSGRILRSGEMRLHFTRFLHGFGVGLDRDVLCCPQNIGEAAA